ncbi:hypothetical protein Tco_0388555 [Tanacetum coccineum]
MQNLRFILRYENKEYVLDEQIPTIDDDLTQEEIEAHQKKYDDPNKVSCIMASSMSLELQKTFENTWAYEMDQQLKEMSKGSRRLKHGELNLVMGNRKIMLVTRIGKYKLMLKSGVRIDLNH